VAAFFLSQLMNSLTRRRNARLHLVEGALYVASGAFLSPQTVLPALIVMLGGRSGRRRHASGGHVFGDVRTATWGCRSDTTSPVPKALDHCRRSRTAFDHSSSIVRRTARCCGRGVIAACGRTRAPDAQPTRSRRDIASLVRVPRKNDGNDRSGKTHGVEKFSRRDSGVCQ